MKGAHTSGMRTTWLIVGHRAGARILEHKGKELQLVSEVDHEEGKLRDGQINSDRPGRAYDRAGPGRHSMGSEESPHDHVSNVFARELAEVLRVGRAEKRYDRLVLVAEPRFLGKLRNALDAATGAMVEETVGKDLAKVAVKDLAGHLRDVILI